MRVGLGKVAKKVKKHQASMLDSQKFYYGRERLFLRLQKCGRIALVTLRACKLLQEAMMANNVGDLFGKYSATYSKAGGEGEDLVPLDPKEQKKSV